MSLLGMFTGGWSSIIGYGVAMIAGAALLGGAYVFVYDKGYDAAQLKCNSAQIQRNLDAKDAEYQSLLKQYNDQKAVIVGLEAKKTGNKATADTATQIIVRTIHDTPSCGIDGPTIDTLNTVRNGANK